jgi:hypothetical protein
METYPVDIDAGQVVRWFRAELGADPSRFRVTGWRSRETETIPLRRELRLGDEEREDLSEVATVATLDIAPVDADEGWRLSVVVEDESGPRISDRGTRAAAERPIDLETFYKEFIRPDRGTANVTAEARDSSARIILTALIDAIEEDRHDSGRGAPA